jgi:hypothetical protein
VKADLAFVFHWTIEAIDSLLADELALYHQLALERLRSTWPISK